ncbi:hypothetical protein ABEF95_016220 [Exophiala dermatitidis]
MAAPTVARMSTASGGVCSTCLARIVRQPSSSATFVRSSIHATRKLHNGVLAAHREPKNSGASPHNFVQDYFSANNSIERGWVKSGLLAAMRTVAEPPLEGNTGLTREERLKRAREEFEKISLDHRIATTEKADGRKVESEISFLLYWLELWYANEVCGTVSSAKMNPPAFTTRIIPMAMAMT